MMALGELFFGKFLTRIFLFFLNPYLDHLTQLKPARGDLLKCGFQLVD
jgi:hypothetical protein